MITIPKRGLKSFQVSGSNPLTDGNADSLTARISNSNSNSRSIQRICTQPAAKRSDPNIRLLFLDLIAAKIITDMQKARIMGQIFQYCSQLHDTRQNLYLLKNPLYDELTTEFDEIEKQIKGYRDASDYYQEQIDALSDGEYTAGDVSNDVGDYVGDAVGDALDNKTTQINQERIATYRKFQQKLNSLADEAEQLLVEARCTLNKHNDYMDFRRRLGYSRSDPGIFDPDDPNNNSSAIHPDDLTIDLDDRLTDLSEQIMERMMTRTRNAFVNYIRKRAV